MGFRVFILKTASSRNNAMSFKKREDIINISSSIKKRLTEIDAEREQIVSGLEELKTALANIESPSFSPPAVSVTAKSSPDKKIALFRHLFRGREDARLSSRTVTSPSIP